MDFNEYVSKGVAFSQEGEIGQAIENFEAALRIQPDNTDLQDMVEELKAQADAIAKFRQLCVDEAKARAEVMSRLYGVKLENLTDIDKTIASAKGILASAYYIRGLMFESKGEPAQAAEDYSEAIKNEPVYPLAYNKRARVNVAIGNYEQAIEDFKKSNLDDLQLKQSLADIYMRRGIEYDKKNDYAHAAQDFARALEFFPDDNTARELLDMARAQM